jgi:hypothetical protein
MAELTKEREELRHKRTMHAHSSLLSTRVQYDSGVDHKAKPLRDRAARRVSILERRNRFCKWPQIVFETCAFG